MHIFYGIEAERESMGAAQNFGDGLLGIFWMWKYVLPSGKHTKNYGKSPCY